MTKLKPSKIDVELLVDHLNGVILKIDSAKKKQTKEIVPY